MSENKPNKFIAPIVIVGVVVGFLASAYKFVLSKPKPQPKPQMSATDIDEAAD